MLEIQISLIMKNYSQNENPEDIPKNLFMGFGKFLFIYACFFTIMEILVFISNILNVSEAVMYLYANLSLIGTVILLLPLVLNGRKINFNLYPNSKIHSFYIGLVVWLIMYVMVLGMPLFFTIYVGINMTIFYGCLLMIADISQIIAWISLYSFFRNPKDLITTKIGKYVSISLILLIIESFLQILYVYFDALNPSTAYISIYGLHTTYQLYMLIFSAINGILFITGYFMLSVTLMRKKITIREKNPDILKTTTPEMGNNRLL